MARIKMMFVALAALATVSTASAQQPTGRLQIEGEYTQAASGMTFPATLGDFRRVSVTRYAADGSDEGASYQANGEFVLTTTVYVYPSPAVAGEASPNLLELARAAACALQFEQVRQELARVHPNMEVIERGERRLTQAGTEYHGLMQISVVNSPSAFGQSHPPLRSEAYLFCHVGGRWSVKYRFTYPDGADAHQLISAFMTNLAWSIAPSAPQQ